MELFEKECRYCKSKNHASEDCPHERGIIFSDTKCAHCGSNEHATKDCPHERGIFFSDTKCAQCGSNGHATKDCPHEKGIFFDDTKCGYCGSKSHATKECPHERGILLTETKCAHCGSRDHATTQCPHTRQSSSMTEWLGKLLGGILVIAGVIWLALNVILPLLVINISVITLLAGLFFKKKWAQFMLSVSVLGGIFIILDYNKGWFTRSLAESVGFLGKLVPYFFYLNIASGLVALFFLIDKHYLKTNNAENAPLKNKQRHIAIIAIVFLGFGIVALQKIVLDKSNIYAVASKTSGERVSTPASQGINRQSTNSSEEPSRNESSSTTQLSGIDRDRMNTIRNFVQAEDSRDFNALYAYFSPAVEKYWDLNNPSYDDLLKRYTHEWGILTNSSNIVNEIKKIDDITYDMYNTFTFTGKKSGEIKTVNSIVRFTFNSDGKITAIDESKQNNLVKPLSKEEKWAEFWNNFTLAFFNRDKEKIKSLTAGNFFSGGGGESIDEWLNDIAFASAFTEIKKMIGGGVKNIRNANGGYYKATGQGDHGDLYFEYIDERWQFGGVIGD